MTVPARGGLVVLIDLLLFLFIAALVGVVPAVLLSLGVPLLGFLSVGLCCKPGTVRLEQDEKVISTLHPSGPVVWLAYAFTLGIYAYWRAAKQLTVTDRRVVYLEGLISKTERSLPLHFVQDATLRSVLWSSRVSLSTAGGAAGFESFGPSWTDEARSLKDTIVDRARQSRQPAPIVAPSDDMVGQLQSLQDLHHAGALSVDEFTAAKGRLLQNQGVDA
jgi:hypothetical protein